MRRRRHLCALLASKRIASVQMRPSRPAECVSSSRSSAAGAADMLPTRPHEVSRRPQHCWACACRVCVLPADVCEAEIEKRVEISKRMRDNERIRTRVVCVESANACHYTTGSIEGVALQSADLSRRSLSAPAHTLTVKLTVIVRVHLIFGERESDLSI